MRSLLNIAVVVTAAITLTGCPDRKPRPVPGPQSALAHSPATAGSTATADDAASAASREAGASEISWFQGTLEEAFARRACHERRGLFHY
jgi:hypothetical protein